MPTQHSEKYRQSIGRYGEQIAQNFLVRRNYKIITLNFKRRGGEIDIIADDDGQYVFVEVKTRIRELDKTPEDSVSKSKLRKMETTGLSFLRELGIRDLSYRLDILVVEIDREKNKLNLRHTKGVC